MGKFWSVRFWSGLVWSGLVWSGQVWYGLVWSESGEGVTTGLLQLVGHPGCSLDTRYTLRSLRCIMCTVSVSVSALV